MTRVDENQPGRRSIWALYSDYETGKSIAMLKPRSEVPRPDQKYSQHVAAMRQLIDTCPEVGAVFDVAATQVSAHVFDATGGRNTRARMLNMWRSADQGDGGESVLARCFRDFITAGWFVVGNDYGDTSVIQDFYHIDAAYTRFNTDGVRQGDQIIYKDEAPLIYEDGKVSPLYRDPAGRWTDAWWGIYMPRSKREIAQTKGNWPGVIPLWQLYDMIRQVVLARLVRTGELTGEIMTKLIATNLTTQAISDARIVANTDADVAAKNMGYDVGRAGTALIVTDTENEAKFATATLRESMNVEEIIKAGEEAMIYICAVIGVNPMDVNARLSGAGGLNEGTKARVADDLREGRAVSRFIKSWLSQFAQWTAPKALQPAFTFNDPRDDARRAGMAQTWAGVIGSLMDKQLIDEDQARAILAYEEVLPPGTFDTDPEDVQTVDEMDNPEALDDMAEDGGDGLIDVDVDEIAATKIVQAEIAASPSAPVVAGAAAPAGDQIQDLALNGAQIASLVQVITAVSAGELDSAAAFEVIRAGFPRIPVDAVNRMLAAAKKIDAPEPVAKAGIRETLLRIEPTRVTEDNAEEVTEDLKDFLKEAVQAYRDAAPEAKGKLKKAFAALS